MIARYYNCRIFVTVGSESKRKMLMAKFDNLTDDCFSSSRSTVFEHKIKRDTRGRGVDLVLNSLAEDKLHVSDET